MSKCIVHYKPSDLQIMHFNTHASDDQVSGDYATDKGYTFAVLDEALVSKLTEMGRECKAVLTDGVITDLVASVNSVQPPASEEVDLAAEIAARKARIAVLEAE